MPDAPELFRRIVEASTDGLWIVDANGGTTYINPRMGEMLGRSPEDMVGFDMADALDANGRAGLAEHRARLVTDEVGRDNLEAQFVRADGSLMWALVSYTPVRDDHGARIGWLYRVTEYAARENLFETLQVREQQLATAQRIAGIGSWDVDLLTDQTRWSDQVFTMFEVDPATFGVSRGAFMQFVHPDDVDRVRVQVAAAGAGATDGFSIEARIVLSGGRQRWMRALGAVERNEAGTPVRIAGTAQDITELKTADAQGAAATRRLGLLQEMSSAANQARTLDEALGLAAAGLPHFTAWHAAAVFVCPEDGEPVLVETYDDQPASPDPDLARVAVASGEIAVGPPDGLAETHSLVAIPVTVLGRVVCVVEVLADEVPPDENSHELMRQIAGQLSLVAGRERAAVELAEARDEAMEASRLKSEFLATMSHEIRTPMNGVIGLNELLLRTELDDHQRRLAEGLQSAGLTLLTIINDILDLSKIEAGKLELEAADFDVRDVFDQTAAVLSGPAHHKGLELVVACHPGVPAFLNGDAVRFRQIITNLGSNAVKFTDRGEVVIRATMTSETPTEVVLRVDVTDTGLGIAPDAREHLFESFTQADPSTTRRHGGTGLGLAISQQLVQAMGGEIGFDSDPGHGSAFWFTARFTRATATAFVRLPLPHLLASKRVLVVDDNETNRFVLTEQLASWHLRAVAVASADEGLATLREAARSGRPFDAAVLDLKMPGTDGLELARRVRADPTIAAVTLLLLSSDQTVGLREARAAGFGAALSKPVRHSELYDLLVSMLASEIAEAAPPAERATPSLGLTVLVVEDNAVNQLVATGLLETLGCKVDVASDGIDAVAMLTGDHPYAAVLMDCRMPRMDGYDATRAVRAQERRDRRVPIIAMTASALEGERERCLAAGMDDFLTKPVDGGDLERVVRRWTGPQAVGASDLDAGSAGGPAAGVVLDPARVRMLDELTKDGVSFFERTAMSFMSRIRDQVQAIQDAIGAHDANRTLTSSHLVKGSALNLGLPRVAAAAARVETHGEHGRTSGTEEMMADLTREVDRAIEALREATRPTRTEP
ncbi:MAG: barA 1 [Nocardioides sp.]|nr:barA 1 [Nocardioides sp.]